MDETPFTSETIIILFLSSSELGSDAGSRAGSVLSSRSNLRDLRKRLSKAMDPQGYLLGANIGEPCLNAVCSRLFKIVGSHSRDTFNVAFESGVKRNDR